MEKLKQQIIETAMQLYKEQGLLFTLDDIASSLHIAKKTIYKVFANKEELLLSVLDYGYTAIYQTKKEILEADLPYIEKLKKVMVALPDEYVSYDFRELNKLHEQYPLVYEKLQEYLNSEWDPIIDFIKEGEENGELRKMNISLFQSIFVSGIEAFLNQDLLAKNDISYEKALEELIEILVEGIRRK